MRPGAHVGNYVLHETIGQGASGTVWRGRHQHLGAEVPEVAIKVLHSALAHDHEARRRFLYEAKAALAAAHDNVVKVIDYGVTEAGECYLIMELLVGESLADRLKRGPLDELTAIEIGQAVADALATAHVRGVLHRDVKPGNLFLTNDKVKILDFGVAKLAQASQGTPAGNVVGTLRYIAPELCRGTQDSSPQSDLYSFGCVLYELVTGRPPFVAKEAAMLVTSHLFDKPAPPSQHARLLPDFERLIVQCLEKDPSARPPSMAVVRQRLAELLDDARDPTAAGQRRRRRWAIAVGAAALAVAALAALLLW